MAHRISYSSLLVRIKTECNEYASHRNPIRFTISTRFHGPGRLSGYNRPDCCTANSAFSHYEFNLLNVKQFILLDLRKMMILRMILLGLTAADGFYSQTLNAVHHYRTGYYNRNSFSKCYCLQLFWSIKTHIFI